jgi:hypothetical protein
MVVRISLSLSHFFLRIYFFELFIKSSFFTVLVQTLRILFNFILKSCVEFVEEYKLS